MEEVQKHPEKFDIKVVYDHFEASLIGDDDIDLRVYLKGCEELNKFLTLLGVGFGFIRNDFYKNVDHLNHIFWEFNIVHLYRTVKTMIGHEERHNLLDTLDGTFFSGTWALLTVHRILEFIMLLLKQIGELPDQDTTSTACRKTYDQTLSKYHSFFVRNGTKVAIYFLPRREALLKKICGDDEHVQQTLNLLPKTFEIWLIVHTRIGTLYTLNKLLSHQNAKLN